MTGNEAVLSVASALDDCGISYMLVGSYSTNVYGIPRSNIDWDYVYEWCEQHGTRALLDEIRASVPPI